MRHLSTVGHVRGWSPGASWWPGRSVPRSVTRSTGDVRCPGSVRADAPLLIVGLAPAAHGGEPHRPDVHRRPRRATCCSPPCTRPAWPTSRPRCTAATGSSSSDTRITAPVHCAPPDNKPTPAERDTCGAWLRAELALLRPRAGGRGAGRLRLAGAAAGARRRRVGRSAPRPAVRARRRTSSWPGTEGRCTCFGCYHVSQQNTFTGKLTPAMLEDVLRRAARAAEIPGRGSRYHVRRGSKAAVQGGTLEAWRATPGSSW